MKNCKMILIVMMFLLAIHVFSCSTTQVDGYRITIITQSMDCEFWQVIKQGAKDAAEEYSDVKLVVLAPAREINIDQQVNILEDQVLKHVSAIAISPCGTAEIIPILDKAHINTIPVIIFNSDIEWEHKLSFVGTDNRLGGRLAGEFIIKALNGKGKVAVIRGIVGIRGHEERVGGFLDVIKTATGIEIVTIQPANSERELALTVMENILTLHPDLDAVFITNDGMALGALEAIDIHHLIDKIITVGFDAGQEAVKALRDGRLTAIVAQDPYNMGKQTFLAALKAAKGETIEKRIDTGTALIDKSNVDEFYTPDNTVKKTSF